LQVDYNGLIDNQFLIKPNYIYYLKDLMLWIEIETGSTSLIGMGNEDWSGIVYND